MEIVKWRGGFLCISVPFSRISQFHKSQDWYLLYKPINAPCLTLRVMVQPFCDWNWNVSTQLFHGSFVNKPCSPSNVLFVGCYCHSAGVNLLRLRANNERATLHAIPLSHPRFPSSSSSASLRPRREGENYVWPDAFYKFSRQTPTHKLALARFMFPITKVCYFGFVQTYFTSVLPAMHCCHCPWIKMPFPS